MNTSGVVVTVDVAVLVSDDVGLVLSVVDVVSDVVCVVEVVAVLVCEVLGEVVGVVIRHLFPNRPKPAMPPPMVLHSSTVWQVPPRSPAPFLHLVHSPGPLSHEKGHR